MAPEDDRSHWSEPRPRHLPGPSFWPAGLAFSLVLLVIGPALQYTVAWLFVGAGVAIFVLSLSGWLREVWTDIQNREEGTRRD